MLRSLGFGPLRRSRLSIIGAWGRSGSILTFLRFLLRLVIYSSHDLSPNPEIKPYRYLCTYRRKVLCAWADVSVATCPSRAMFWLPGVAIWSKIFEILLGAVDIYVLGEPESRNKTLLLHF